MGTGSRGDALAMARRRRGGRYEAELHAAAQRRLAEADASASVKQTILMALRDGRPVKQKCLCCGQAAQHCQLWGPPELTQAVPDPTAQPAVYWLCDTHRGEVSTEAMVVRRVQRGRGRRGA